MKKHIKNEKGFPALLTVGTLISLGTVGATSLVLALASSFTNDPTALTGALSLISLLASGVISAVINSRKNAESGTLIATLSALVAAVIMLAAGLIMKGGLVPFGTLLNHAAFVGISALAATLTKRKPHRAKRRYSY